VEKRIKFNFSTGGDRSRITEFNFSTGGDSTGNVKSEALLDSAKPNRGVRGQDHSLCVWGLLLPCIKRKTRKSTLAKQTRHLSKQCDDIVRN
jgi:hypothetical protein